jgi:Transcriptional regulators
MNPELKELLGALSEVMKYIHQRSYHTMSDKHLYPGQPKLLSIIRNNEGVTQRDLAEKNLCTPATITGMLNKLEANHYVYRVPDETDKRIMRVYLTEEGRNMAVHSEKFMISLIEHLFTGFSDDELHTLLMFSNKLKINMHSYDKT